MMAFRRRDVYDVVLLSVMKSRTDNAPYVSLASAQIGKEAATGELRIVGIWRRQQEKWRRGETVSSPFESRRALMSRAVVNDASCLVR